MGVAGERVEVLISAGTINDLNFPVNIIRLEIRGDNSNSDITPMKTLKRQAIKKCTFNVLFNAPIKKGASHISVKPLL